MDSQPFQPQPQPAEQDFDIWEFVSCTKCQLAFSPDGVSGPSVPFWITECGHVICNNHLSACLQKKKHSKCVAEVELDPVDADQSCPSCNAQGIELMPLQKEMPPPFSDWFCSLPFKLDALAQAAKFQHERTAGAARYYKSRYEQYRAMCIRMKNEVAQVKMLRKEVEALKSENARLQGVNPNQQQQSQQQNSQYQQEPASYVNVNGKRRLLDNQLSTSSPRSIHTPLGPSRITLPPDHEPPPSLARLGASEGLTNGNDQRLQASSSRTMQPPGSSHFSQQYAYTTPQSYQTQLPSQQVLSHEQLAPIRQQMQQSERRLMPPPPTPIQGRQLDSAAQGRPVQRLATPRMPGQMQFNQNQSRMEILRPSNQSSQQQSGQFQSAGQASRRFMPPASASGLNSTAGPSNSQRFMPATPNTAQRRFAPPTPNVGVRGRFMPMVSSDARRVRGT